MDLSQFFGSPYVEIRKPERYIWRLSSELMANVTFLKLQGNLRFLFVVGNFLFEIFPVLELGMIYSLIRARLHLIYANFLSECGQSACILTWFEANAANGDSTLSHEACTK